MDCNRLSTIPPGKHGTIDVFVELIRPAPERSDIPGHDTLPLFVVDLVSDAAFYGKIGILYDLDKKKNIPVTHAERHDENLRDPENPKNFKQFKVPGRNA